MITILVDHNSITATGHANYDVPGKDIVCAGVSTLMQTLELRGRADKGKGNMIVLTEDEDALQLTLDGLRLIARHYPDYVEVKE